MTSRPAERGFTLLEMVVVLAVLALLSGLVIARGPQRSAAVEMRQAASLLSGTFRLARARAIAGNRPVAVRLDPAAATVQLADELVRPLPRGIAITGGPRAIVFQPDGSTSGGTIALAGDARTAEVAVSWLTGRVTVAGSGLSPIMTVR